MDVDVLIQPIVLRFSLIGDEVVYHFAGGAEAQLDDLERRMGIDPATTTVFDSNLGFLPVCSTVLIRAERNILVDPGNTHIGFYGLLGNALRQRGLTPEDIDLLVATHSHHDHMANVVQFPGAELILGAGELDFAREAVGPTQVQALVGSLGGVTEVPRGEEVEVCHGVRVISTPGHTPGHVAVLADTGTDSFLMTGDAAMTQREFETGQLGHWYLGDQLEEMRRSLDHMRRLGPSVVIPGHDRAFRFAETGLR